MICAPITAQLLLIIDSLAGKNSWLLNAGAQRQLARGVRMIDLILFFVNEPMVYKGNHDRLDRIIGADTRCPRLPKWQSNHQLAVFREAEW